MRIELTRAILIPRFSNFLMYSTIYFRMFIFVNMFPESQLRVLNFLKRVSSQESQLRGPESPQLPAVHPSRFLSFPCPISSTYCSASFTLPILSLSHILNLLQCNDWRAPPSSSGHPQIYLGMEGSPTQIQG